MPLLYVLEQRRSPTEDDGVHDQPELVDEALVHQTANQRGAADGVHVLAGLLLHAPDRFDVSNDPCVLPGDVIQRPRQDEMGRSFREARVSDLARRRDLAGGAHGRVVQPPTAPNLSQERWAFTPVYLGLNWVVLEMIHGQNTDNSIR
jgi:hypothetical protein